MAKKSPLTNSAPADIQPTVIENLRALRSFLNESQQTLGYALDLAEAKDWQTMTKELVELYGALSDAAAEVRVICYFVTGEE